MLLPCIISSPGLLVIAPCKFLQHGIIITCVVTSDMPDLKYLARGNRQVEKTYLVHNTQPITYLKQCLVQTYTIMSCVHLGETKEHVLQRPIL